MAHDIFICHASEDRGVADALVAGLEGTGLTCWIAPRDVMAGADYAQAIVSGISGAKALVLVFSAHSNASPHIGREVERAVSRGINIIPFRIEEVEPSPSLEYFISASQWLDATSGATDEHVGELARTIRVLVYGQEGEPTRQAAGEILRQIIEQYGPALADDPRRVRALLRDKAGEHRAEVAALVAAAEEGVGAALLQSSSDLTPETAKRMANRLQDNRALTEEAANWAVAAWSDALGVHEPAPPDMTRPVAGGLPETVANVMPVPTDRSDHPAPQVEVPAPAAQATVPAQAPDRPARSGAQPGAASGEPATIAAEPGVSRGAGPAPPAAPPASSSRSWLFPVAIGAVVVAGIIGGVALFSGDGAGDEGGPVTTPPPATTTAPQRTTLSQAKFFTFEGLTVADIVDRYPAEAASIGLPSGCAAIVELIPVDVETDRLQPTETFVWARFAAPFCEAEIWGIADADGALRELTVQVAEPTGESVRQMTDMALALVGAVGFPEADGQFAKSALDEFGWLNAPDPASHEGDAEIGAIQLGTFLHEGGFTFYLVPSR